MPYPHRHLTELPLIRMYRGNTVELTVDPDEWRQRRLEQAALSQAQRERMAEILRNRIKPIPGVHHGA